MLVEHIKELLFKHDCVVIPGFGGLIARYEGATIHPTKHSLIPPRKKLAFNKSIQESDGLLESAIAKKENISIEEAVVEIKIFISKIEAEIKEIGHSKIEGIGKFYYNEEFSIQFDADEKENFLEESYSLPELYFKPIEREDEEMSKVPPRPRPVVRRPPVGQPAGAQRKAAPTTAKQRPSKPPKAPKEKKEREANKQPIYIILPILLIVVGLAGSLMFKSDTFMSETASLGGSDSTEANADNQGSEENAIASTTDSETEESSTEEESTMIVPEDESTNEVDTETDVASTTEATSETVEDKAEEKVVEEVKPEPEIVETATITESNGRYHIIAGSFSSRSNANKLIRRIGTGTVLEPKGSSSLVKVSVKSYPTRAAAKADLGNLEGTYGSGLWIYKH